MKKNDSIRMFGEEIAQRCLDKKVILAIIRLTTLPLQAHSVDFCLGRKNRLTGGFFISADGKVQ